MSKTINKSKIIICVDMDAYFASIEQQTNPKLRGKPIAVVGTGHRTVITTRSYEARKYGVKTGMNIYEAKRLCPDIIFVIGNNEKYTYTCIELQKIYLQFTPDVEIYSIDEAFLDITTTHHLFGGPEAIGRSIKEKVQNQFGITCSIGIAPNILLAKLASELAKPNGLKWIKPEEIDSLLEDLPVEELWGIGKSLSKKLEILGIKTCGELKRTPVSILRSKFGIIGEHLKSIGAGLYDRSLIIQEKDPKSIGHSMTFPKDLSSREEIEAELLKLSDMVGRRARKHCFVGKKVSLTIRYPDFETFSRQKTLPDYTNHTHEIYKNTIAILNDTKLKKSVRLLGVCLSSLIKDNNQIPLFEDKKKEKMLLQTIDQINDKYGEFKIIWASYLKHLEPPRVISPAWRPSGIRNITIKNTQKK
jgi:DNA polymerase-4